VSLWSGAGGLDLGLQQAGYDVVLAADHDEWACRTHGFNSEALVVCRDLHDPDKTTAWLRSLELSDIALVAGGFPCQPYSRAGHSRLRQLVASAQRPAVDKRVLAWRTFVAAIAELRPERALAENVPDLARFNGGRQLRDIVRALEDVGYEVDVRLIPARLFGVPQFRERLFIQAVRAGQPIAWPEPQSDFDDSLWTAIGDLPPVEAGHLEDVVQYAPQGTPPPWARSDMPEASAHLLFDHIVRDVRADDMEAFRRLKPGGTYLDVPEELRRYDHENFTDKYKRLERARPSRTITAHIARDGYWYIHPEQHRTLSIREAARVQTFPDWFRFAGFPSNRLTQIGNAVPPLMGRAIGEAMLQAGESDSAPTSTVPAAAGKLVRTAASMGKRAPPGRCSSGKSSSTVAQATRGSTSS
jgi:DNA (cytosine-5)-methyltransferase 1